MNIIEINTLLEQYDTYIIALSYKKVSSRSAAFHSLMCDGDELAQRVRLKLWHALEKRQILNYRTYIRQVVQNEFIDMIRGRKWTYPLPLDKEGELPTDGTLNPFLLSSEKEPSTIIIQKEMFTEHLTKIAQAIIALPPQQKKVMMCLLRDEVDDLHQLCTVFRKQTLSLEKVEWPIERQERRRLKASLSQARQKLHTLKEEFLQEKRRDSA